MVETWQQALNKSEFKGVKGVYSNYLPVGDVVYVSSLWLKMFDLTPWKIPKDPYPQQFVSGIPWISGIFLGCLGGMFQGIYWNFFGWSKHGPKATEFWFPNKPEWQDRNPFFQWLFFAGSFLIHFSSWEDEFPLGRWGFLGSARRLFGG